MPFWKEIKRGADNFEVTKREVAVNVCNRHYVFNAAAADGSPLDPEGACPALKQDVDVAARVAERERADDAEVAQLTVQGVQPVRLVYQDGGQNPVFANRIADVSRPEALAAGPVEIALNERGRKLPPGAQSSSPKIAAAPPVAAPTQIAQGAAAPAPAESGFSSVSSLIGMLRGGDQPAAAPPAPAPVAAPAPAAQASGGKSSGDACQCCGAQQAYRGRQGRRAVDTQQNRRVQTGADRGGQVEGDRQEGERTGALGRRILAADDRRFLCRLGSDAALTRVKIA